MGRIGEKIRKYSALGFDRYHTPGHKGEKCGGDITELGLCGEIFPDEVIELAEADTAKLYGVKKIRYLTGGSSMGIKAALGCFAGKKVVYAAGVHRAFTEACELWGICALPASGEQSSGIVFTCNCGELPEPITADIAQNALDNHPDAAALFITSPDYLGRTADIAVAELCQNRGVALIVDSAHGAHFAFAPGLNEFRFDNVADMCNMSVHKTLGAYTQSALLALNNEEYFAKAERNLELLGTTSPNYVMFAALEDGVCEAAANRADYERLREFAAKMRGVADCVKNSDYTRLCVRKRGLTGGELFAKFVEKRIMPETAIGDLAVFILTPHDGRDKLERLYAAAKNIM